MSEKKPKSILFDYETYGVFLRIARQRAGFNRAEDFCKTVFDWTCVPINKEALYRIEKGVQPPTVEQLMAFGLILRQGKGIYAAFDKTELARCLTPLAEHLATIHGTVLNVDHNGKFTAEIVYCKDCKHYIDGECMLDDGNGDYLRLTTPPESFCGWGERKEG